MKHGNVKSPKCREGLLSWLSKHWKKISLRRCRLAVVFCCCSLLLLAPAPAAFAFGDWKTEAKHALDAIVNGFGTAGGIPDVIDSLGASDSENVQLVPGGQWVNRRTVFGTFTKDAFDGLKTALVDKFFSALNDVNSQLGKNGIGGDQLGTWKASAETALTAIVNDFGNEKSSNPLDPIDKLGSTTGNTRKEFGVATQKAFNDLKTALVDKFFSALNDVNSQLGENGIGGDQLEAWKTKAENALTGIVTNVESSVSNLGTSDGWGNTRTAFGTATKDAFDSLKTALVDNLFGALNDVDNAIVASLMNRVNVLEEGFGTLMGPEGCSNDCCYGIIPEMRRDIGDLDIRFKGLEGDLNALTYDTIPEIWDYLDAMACKCDDRFADLDEIVTNDYTGLAAAHKRIDDEITERAAVDDILKGRVNVLEYDTIPEIWDYLDAMACKCDDRFADLEGNLTKIYDDITTLQNDVRNLQSLPTLGAEPGGDGMNACLGELRRDVTTLESKVDGANGLVAKVATLMDDRDEAEGNITALQTGLAAASTDIATLKAEVSNVKDVASTKGLLKMAGQIGALKEKVNNTVSGLEATYAIANSLNSAVTDSGTGLAAAHNKITAEITDRAEADTTLQDKIDETNARVGILEETVGNEETGLVAAHNRITAEITAREEADGILQGNIDETNARVGTLEVTVGNEETGLVADVAALKVTVNDADTGLAATYAKICEEITAREALQDRVDVLEETVGNEETGLVAAHNRITAEITARAEADGILQNDIAELYGRVGDLEETVDNPYTGLVARFAVLDDIVTDGYTGLEAAHNRIGNLEGIVGDDSTGLVARFAVLDDIVTDDYTGLAATYEKVCEEITAREAADGILQSRVGTLEGIVGDDYTGLVADVGNLKWEFELFKSYLGLDLLPMVGADSKDAEYANYAGHAASCLAGTVANAAAVVQNCLSCRLCDVKGNGNDPFLQVFGGYGKRGEISDLSYNCATYGILLGEDFVKQLGDSAFLKLGGAVSFAHNNVKFSGKGAENGKKGEQNILFGNLFGAYEGFGEENLKTDINALIGFGYSRNRVRRTDVGNNKFDVKFPSTDFNVSCELVKNFFHLGNAQVGPWMKVVYNHIAQKKYAESEGIGMSKSRFNYLNTTLGINLEWEFSNASDEYEEQKLSDASSGEPAKQEPNDIRDEERRLRLFAKFGWECQPIRSRSGYTVTFNGDQFEPNFGNGNKHFFVAVCGFRYKLSTHFEISSNVAGRITGDDRCFNVNAGLGYSF